MREQSLGRQQVGLLFHLLLTTALSFAYLQASSRSHCICCLYHQVQSTPKLPLDCHCPSGCHWYPNFDSLAMLPPSSPFLGPCPRFCIPSASQQTLSLVCSSSLQMPTPHMGPEHPSSARSVPPVHCVLQITLECMLSSSHFSLQQWQRLRSGSL